MSPSLLVFRSGIKPANLYFPGQFDPVMPGSQAVSGLSFMYAASVPTLVCCTSLACCITLLCSPLALCLCFYLRLLLHYFVRHCSRSALLCRSCVLCLWTKFGRLWWPSWWAVRQQCSPQASEGQNGACHSQSSRHSHHRPHLHPLIGL